MITIREADINDNEGLLALTGVTPMSGAISLRIDRGPDFFRLMELRGEGVVFVALADHRIIGCLSVTYQHVYIDGKPQRVAYVADFKVHPSLSGSRAALKMVQACIDHIMKQGVDLVFNIVAGGNERVISMLTHGKFGFPKFESFGRFLVHEILGSPLREPANLYEIQEGNENDIPGICRICNDFNRSYQLGPLKTEDDFRSFRGAAANGPAMRILTARRDGEIMATLCSFDAGHLKQNVVTAMPESLRLLVNALRFSSKILPFYTFPKVGETIRLLYLRNVAFKEGHRRALRVLLQRVRHEVFRERYSFVTIGLHEHDPLRFLVRGLPKYTFVAEGYVASLHKDRSLLAKIAAGIPMEDFALV